RDPVIVPRIEIAEPRLLAFVASDQFRRFYRLLDFGPFPLTGSAFRWTCLQTSLVRVRARIPYVLPAVGLGKEQRQADAACHLGICGIKALGSRNGDAQVHDVLEWSIGVLRVGGRGLHDVEELPVLVEQRLSVRIEVRWRNSESIVSSDFGR